MHMGWVVCMGLIQVMGCIWSTHGPKRAQTKLKIGKDEKKRRHITRLRVKGESERDHYLMASKLHQLLSKACQASQFVAKHGTNYYRQLLEQNKQYIQEPPTVEKCNLLAKQLFYTRLASIPGRTESFWKELDYAKNLWKNRKELKVEDAGIAALFGLECFAWYCAGEIVGRGFTFTGYYV
ncbi:unnamed protein product [Sphenostylis stenocarpa]|uniref:Mitochondrial ATP synthase subunit G protein n=1 Tax=Sphenostylis stenocarpa TaxID=92480 RepID=A0AA86S0H1_9FABA|nr:unnamed protein product [Sphenostylis stenocarpa]